MIELKNMNISILGYGNLGRSIANGLKSFDSLEKLYVTKKDIENLRHIIEDKNVFYQVII